jgi:hypothetical protein
VEEDYVVCVLTDYSRLDEIYSLTHDSLVDAKYIAPRIDGRVIACPNLDEIPETSIVTAEKNGEIIATVTITLTNPHGLPTDQYFKEETEAICENGKVSVGVISRIATVKKHRTNTRLTMNTLFRGLEIMHASSCHIVLFVVAEKHIRFYKRFFEAEIIASKMTAIDKGIDIPMVLMQAGVQRGWEVFNAGTKRT